VALVLYTIVKRFYPLEPDLGIGNITGNPLLGLEVVLREVSFFPKPINLLDPSFSSLYSISRNIVDCSLVSIPS
jgi:hypothetical protein